MMRRRFLSLVAGVIAAAVGKVPPLRKPLARNDSVQNDIEGSVLGSMMTSPEEIPAVLSITSVAHFSTPQSALVFLEITSLHRRGDRATLEAVTKSFSDLGLLEYVGGYQGLLDMVENTPSSSHASLYAGCLADRWKAGISSHGRLSS